KFFSSLIIYIFQYITNQNMNLTNPKTPVLHNDQQRPFAFVPDLDTSIEKIVDYAQRIRAISHDKQAQILSGGILEQSVQMRKVLEYATHPGLLNIAIHINEMFRADRTMSNIRVDLELPSRQHNPYFGTLKVQL